VTTYIALLRAVNVGGTGKLAMADLKEICRQAGFDWVETYIASGNVVFDSASSPDSVKAELAARLRSHTGKEVGIVVRTAKEMSAVLAANPLVPSDPKGSYVIFLDTPPPADALAKISGQQDEQIRLGGREIYVHYPSGMGRSKLAIPAARSGTARNMNTVTKLVEIASAR
jgi:uncharacterized protein (DUF1697 family)